MDYRSKIANQPGGPKILWISREYGPGLIQACQEQLQITVKPLITHTLGRPPRGMGYREFDCTMKKGTIPKKVSLPVAHFAILSASGQKIWRGGGGKCSRVFWVSDHCTSNKLLTHYRLQVTGVLAVLAHSACPHRISTFQWSGARGDRLTRTEQHLLVIPYLPRRDSSEFIGIVGLTPSQSDLMSFISE